MKKYKLLKDLPTYKAGQMFGLIGENESAASRNPVSGKAVYLKAGLWSLGGDSEPEILAYAQKTLDKFPNILEDWFEEIGKSEEANESKIWEPKLDRKYYNINNFGFISNSTNDGTQIDQFRIGIGNCFHTEEEAEKAIRRLEALRRLRKKGLRFTVWLWRNRNSSELEETLYPTIRARLPRHKSLDEFNEIIKDLNLLFKEG